MINISNKISKVLNIELVWENDEILETIDESILRIFNANKLDIFYNPCAKEPMLYVGIGEYNKLENIDMKEIFAKVSKEIKKMNIKECSINVSKLYKEYKLYIIPHIVEGLILGGYDYSKNEEKNRLNCIVNLYGIDESEVSKAIDIINERTSIMEGVIFARNVVNAPGNKLRPSNFIYEISKLLQDVNIEIEILDYKKLESIGMHALLSVGDSSKFKPYLLIARYINKPDDKEIFGLIGKGVTCDSGGYCLKPANSMLGIRGDMAGAASVIGAIYALAKNNIKTNVVAITPICENRISDSSLLPGDVISSYSGKTIEILNTDAEGRLILADAVSYGVINEKITKVLDIATLTGAVVNLLGFSIGGVMCDNQELFNDFERAYNISGERYLRLPFYKEHKSMIESNIADIKNLGKSHCGTLTAGLFIREFAQGKPWIHIDIAGTAWVEPPIFEYQSKGATGAGVTTIYELCKGE